MAIDACSTHGKPKSYHCYVCHKPLCPECPSRDGCCSDACQQRRFKFGGRPTKTYRPGWSPIPLLVTLVKVGAFVGVVYFAAKKMGWLEELPF